MAKRVMPISRNWLRWSPTKLESALRCPLGCFFDQMLKVEAPLNASAALGQAMHHMFEVFYKPHKSTGNYPYQTLDKFLGAWKGFYWMAVKGKHGFSSTHEDPREVKWKDSEHQGKMFAYGIKILTMFFNSNAELRLDGTPRFLERRFQTKWNGITLSGIIDRIDLRKEGAIILDYKPWNYLDYKIESDIQMTTYQLAYEEYLKTKIGNNLPLHALQIYSYWNDSVENIPIRTSEDFGLLLRYLVEASEYYRSILTSNPVRREIVDEFRFFSEMDIKNGDISPVLPRGLHCSYCQHSNKCRQWELGNHESARKLFSDKHNQDKSNLQPDQIIIPFKDDIVVDRGKKYYNDLLKREKPCEQLSLDF